MLHGFFFIPPIEDNWIGHIVGEIYKDRVYDPYLQGKKDLTVIDIGANVGFASYYFSRYAKQVYSLEPSQEHFMVLSKMVEFNNLINVKPINKALYIENTKLPFYHNKNRTMYSLHQAVNDGSTPPEMVEAVTLDKLFDDEKIDHVDIMKIDCEGSEIEILSSAGFKKVAPKIDLVIGERHAWSGRHPNQLNEALRMNGFVVEQIANDADIFVARKK